MTDLMYVLYDYVRDNELRKYLQTQEYFAAQAAVAAREKRLLEQYPGLFGPLDDLLSAINADHALELEAMFQAALSFILHLPQSL